MLAASVKLPSKAIAKCNCSPLCPLIYVTDSYNTAEISTIQEKKPMALWRTSKQTTCYQRRQSKVRQKDKEMAVTLEGFPTVELLLQCDV